MDALKVTKVHSVLLDRIPYTADKVTSHRKERLSGTLHLTTHHLFFSPDQSTSASNLPAELWVDYPSISLLNRLPQTIGGLYPLQVRTKAFDSWILLFNKERDGGAEDVWQSIRDCAIKCEDSELHRLMGSLRRAALCILLCSPSCDLELPRYTKPLITRLDRVHATTDIAIRLGYIQSTYRVRSSRSRLAF
jgi:hypothetical protein